ncbi:MAG: hypothetical protein U1F27_06750 [Turneriella sp.]
MRKSVFSALGLMAAFALVTLSCGKSECTKYTDRFCADPKSAACADAAAKVKVWNSTQCRIENNKLLIDDQSKRLEEELK